MGAENANSSEGREGSLGGVSAPIQGRLGTFFSIFWVKSAFGGGAHSVAVVESAESSRKRVKTGVKRGLTQTPATSPGEPFSLTIRMHVFGTVSERLKLFVFGFPRFLCAAGSSEGVVQHAGVGKVLFGAH